MRLQVLCHPSPFSTQNPKTVETVALGVSCFPPAAMAADVVIDPESEKSCCAELKKRFLKLEEKRIALRTAVKLLEEQINRLQAENNQLKNVCEQEKVQVEIEREAKEKESRIRCSLEKEVSTLKTNITCLQEKEKECSRSRADWETEINKLNELLEKERKRGDLERKKAEVEKKKAAEAWKLVKTEKSRAEEAKMLADTERKRLEEVSICLETSKRDAKEAKEKLISESSKVDDAKHRADMEKQKTIREKKRADMAMTKAEEQKKCADGLSLQLEKERQRVQALEKEIQKSIGIEKLKKDSSCSVTKTDLDRHVLGERLKLEKMQTKQGKKRSKLDKVRQHFLQQELPLLKQDALQFSRRLDILEGCCSRAPKGTDGSKKIGGGASKSRCINSNRLFGTFVQDVRCQDENDVIKSKYTTVDDFNGERHAAECTVPLLPISCRSCSQLISGISSELESQVGGSYRNKSQNSAIFSSTASFSDRKLMGSQGRGAFSVTTLASSVENTKQKSAVPTLSDEKYKKCPNEYAGLVDKENDDYFLDKELKFSTFGSTVHDKYEVVDRVSGHSRKRKRDQGELGSFISLHSKDKKLLLKINEKLSALQKTFSLNNTLTPVWSQGDKSFGQIRIEDHLKNTRGGPYKSCEKQSVDPGKEHVSWANDEDLEQYLKEKLEIEGDYMKLLELDNEIEEERYRISMAMPLSPTLPDIKSPNNGISDFDKTDYLVKEGFYREATREGDSSILSHTVDVVDIEINSNKMKFISSDSPQDLCLETICALGDSSSKQIFDNVIVSQSCANESHLLSVAAADGSADKRSSNFFIVFSDTKDQDAIYRILCAWKNCTSRSFNPSQTDWKITEILLALATERDLQPDEKACVFLSTLLCNFFHMASTTPTNFKTGDFSICSTSLGAQMNRAVADIQTSSLLLDLCKGEGLFRIIEDFLIYRKIMEHDVRCEKWVPDGSHIKVISRDDRTIILSSKTATIDQIVAGCIILSSICLAVDHIGFICGASYNILRACRGDSAWALTILHVFASLCGEKYLRAMDYSLVMTVIKCIVSGLERKEVESIEAHCMFSPCLHCPFAEEGKCVDKIVLLLLDKLQDYGISRGHHTLEIYEENLVNGVYFDGHNVERTQTALRSNGVAERILCHFSDIISLLELLVCNMSWDWTYNKIVCHLFKLLESHVSEELCAGILVLIGQSGRLAIEAGGYKQKGIQQLICNLCTILHPNRRETLGFSTQFAAVSSLINLLSLEYEELFRTDLDLKDDTSQCGEAKIIIRKWFSQLSNRQQLLSLRLFQSPDVKMDCAFFFLVAESTAIFSV